MSEAIALMAGVILGFFIRREYDEIKQVVKQGRRWKRHS